MTVSIDQLSTWLVQNGFTPEGSQNTQDAAMDLLALIRDTSATGGDNRNIHDHLKHLQTEEVREALAKTAAPLVSVFVNIMGDMNLSSGLRNNNWFNTRKVMIAGRRKWDRRGAVGTQHYSLVDHAPSAIDAIERLKSEGYRIIGAEISDDAVPLTTYEWQDKSAVIYGEEGAGLSAEVLAAVDDVVFIPGRGSVRSLNVSTTSGIFTYDYMVKRQYI